MTESSNRDEDRINCPAANYLITRKVCRARRRRGTISRCRRCPENTDQLELFSSPLQVAEKKKTRPKSRGRK